MSFVRPALLASSALTTVLAVCAPATVLAEIALTTVLADSRPTALLAIRALTTVLADCRPTALLALSSPTTVLAYSLPTALLARTALTTMRTSTTHLAPRAVLNPVLAWPLRPRGSLPLRALPLEMRLFVFRIYPIVVSDRLHLDIIGDIVVGHFLLDGFDRLDQPVWAPDGGHRMRRYNCAGEQ